MSKNEINLIKKAQQGDELAFNELYQGFYKQAYYFALKVTNCDADALQEGRKQKLLRCF